MVLLLHITSTADKIYVHMYVYVAYLFHLLFNQNDLQMTREQLTATDTEKHIIQTELNRVMVCSYYAYVKVSHECACMRASVRPCVCGCIETSID